MDSITRKKIKEQINNYTQKIDQIYDHIIDKNGNKRYAKLNTVFNIDENLSGDTYFYGTLIIVTDGYKTKIKRIQKTIYTQYVEQKNNKTYIYLKMPYDCNFDLETEHDSAPETWAFYKIRYGNRLVNTHDKYYYKTKNCNMLVHGDVDFNFNMVKINDLLCRIKIDKANSNEQEVQDIKTLLNICSYFNYSLVNYSIMPSRGGLNAAKQNIGNDRFDTFIWALYLYYKKDIKVLILNNSACTASSMNELKKFLDDFNSLEDYFEKIYGIYNDELIKELVVSGAKPLDSIKRIREYIELAYRYWKERNENFNNNQCKDYYYKHDGKIVKFAFLPHLDVDGKLN